MIDVHTHILNGVDDGPADIDESVEIVEQGVKAGVRAFVLTPHIRDSSDWDRIGAMRTAFETLKARFNDRPEIELILSAEILLTPAVPERIKNAPSVAIYGRYLLVELPFYQLPIYADDVLFRLLVDGFIPILAHPERYLYLRGEESLMRRWADNGILYQINTGSLFGKYGFRVKWFAKKLLKNGMAHLLGSDIHAADSGYCSFSKAVEAAGKASGAAGISRFSELLQSMGAGAPSNISNTYT